MRLFTIVTFLLLFLSACLYKNQEEMTPVKPKGIPERAFWVGGLDGGNWYMVNYIHDHKNNADISVYSDDGSLIVSKRFIVICRLDRPTIWLDNLEEQISGFDGEKIYLKSPTGKEICWLQ